MERCVAANSGYEHRELLGPRHAPFSSRKLLFIREGQFSPGAFVIMYSVDAPRFQTLHMHLLMGASLADEP
eukprot:364905-Chlamydomonas_euryale.AAC.20